MKNTFTLAALACLAAIPSPSMEATATSPASFVDACRVTAVKARMARRAEVLSELFLALGICANSTDPDEHAQCVADAWEEFFDGLGEAQEQFGARLDLCDLLGGGPYDPTIDPRDFAGGGADNPFFPLVPGRTLTYQKTTAEGEIEVSVVTFLKETREILGVECVAVRDTESVDGEVVEDTFDYYARDLEGNVWYFGELSMVFEDGFLVDLGGSWIAGEDGASPGIIMPADLFLGQTYRQEFLLGEAEDAATVLSRDASVSVPYGDFDGCRETLDFTPLEPGNVEHKFYAEGIGLVLEVDPANGERLELIDVQD